MKRYLYKLIKLNKESIAIITLAILMMIEYPIETPRFWYLIMAIIIMFLIKGVNSEQIT